MTANTAKGKAAKHHKLLVRLFDGLPVVDATRELHVFILAEDIQCATQNDPLECVFAQACRRSFGSHRVAFFHNYAYAELPLSNGGSRVERFALPKRTRDSILVWDRTGIADPGGYLLMPPSPGCTLDHKLAWSHRYKHPAPGRKRQRLPPTDFRSGTGLVQFLGASKDWRRRRGIA